MNKLGVELKILHL